MTTHALGLVLGSGGARGLAHIGVLKVFAEEGITPAYIAGSSIGALIGALYASGRSPHEIEKISHSIDWMKILKLADVTIGRGAFRGNKLKRFIKEHVGVEDFSELQIPLSIVATDIRTGEIVTFTEGSIADAVRASISFPLVFTPARIAGHTCVDGGLSEPVPVRAVRALGAEVVIAVNLDHVFFKGTSTGYGKLQSVAVNSINLLRYHLAQCNVHDADVVITPDVGKLYWNSFTNGASVIKKGEVATKKILPEIQKLLR